MTCLTMNRFEVVVGREEAFEAVWLGRDSRLKEVDGFLSFHLFKGAVSGEVRLYASHTLWRDRAAFEAWTKSEAFRAAHGGVRSQSDLYAGPPVLEVFDSIQELV
ncbi:antibiotic biosynthesis monooxygenase family protein [Roseisalinus antarcticus]|uniref:Heme oxygenase (Staphylobilin-producing) n=1 Tax=Roseisalinus antarcticus TaxID=254357 RepID=A0A1Y5RJ81_9RHOB|nr:antibiotic biosynthesis monooxygenase [Roseisalinus antarcticus]SLN16144.1 Heme oxygenase (staphylobilin-producing) [Roseisalinus antarcticus]